MRWGREGQSDEEQGGVGRGGSDASEAQNKGQVESGDM